MAVRFLNSTPFRLAAFAMRLHPRRITGTWVVKGTFDLKPGEAAAPREKDAQDMLSGELCGGQDQTGECLYPGDLDPFKPGADLLLKGTCHAPGGKPVPVCTARFGVGGWRKALAVIGKRVWRKSLLGASFDSPAPFASMPLGWSGAFGGPGFKDNPAGKGFRTEELPSQELPDRLIRLPSDQPPPAGFGPVNCRWASRTAKLGTFSRKWAAQRWPALPEDVNWFHYNAAPADQQLAAYLRGDEALHFENLRPGVPRFEARLPGLRIRVFVRDLRGEKRPVREIPMRLDTLYADLDEAKLVLLWRGTGDVLDDELLDVDAILAVSELLSEAPKPPAAYAPEFDRKPEAPVPVPALPPPPAGEIEAKIAAEAAAIQKEVDQRLAAAGESAQRFKASIGPWGRQVLDPRAAAGPAADAAGLLRAPPPSALQTKRELVATLKRAREAHQGMLQKAEGISATFGKAAEMAAASLGAFPMKPPEIPQAAKDVFAPGGPVEGVLKAIGMEGALDAPEGLSNAQCADFLASGRDLAGRDFSGADFSGLVLDGRDLAGCTLRAALFAGASLRGARLASVQAKDADFTGADLSEADLGAGRFDACAFASAKLPGALLHGASFAACAFDEADLSGARAAQSVFRDATFRKAALAGADFRKADLAAADLSGLDLSGAHFDEAILRGATLTSAVLARASLSGADLSDATIVKAVFEEADLTGAVLQGVIGPEADFSRAKLVKADLRNAVLLKASWKGADLAQGDLTRANLSEGALQGAALKEIRGEGAVFAQADFGPADFSGAVLGGADFTQANLPGANFAGADLTAAKMLSVRGAKVKMDGARLAKFSGGEDSDFTGGSFLAVEGPDSSWVGARLDGAKFHGSRLPRALFHRASARGADFSSCDLSGASLRKGKFPGANLSRANLFQGRLAQADLTEARLAGANLFQADLLEAVLVKADLKDANTRGSIRR